MHLSTAEPTTAVDLELVESLVVEMFTAVASSVTAATTAFLEDDRDVARRIAAADGHIDELLATVEAMAEAALVCGEGHWEADRRLLVYVLRTAPELERSADLIEHIAMRTGQGLVRLLPTRARDLLAGMGSVAAAMWRQAADGFVERDPTVGVALRIQDEELDDFHGELIECLNESGCSAPDAIALGLVARFYERLGDHAVNVAYRVNGLRCP